MNLKVDWCDVKITPKPRSRGDEPLPHSCADITTYKTPLTRG